MVYQLSSCVSNFTAPGSSSSTELLGHTCWDSCNTEHTKRSCNFINDHTYRILKKICRRMIKDYHRCQCREKYMIFEGGNSINVRIHRSASRGGRGNNVSRNEQCQSDTTENTTCTRNDPPRLHRKFDPDDDKPKHSYDLGTYGNDKTYHRKGHEFQNRARDGDDHHDEIGNKAVDKSNKPGHKEEDYADDNYRREGNKAKGIKAGSQDYYVGNKYHEGNRKKGTFKQRENRDYYNGFEKSRKQRRADKRNDDPSFIEILNKKSGGRYDEDDSEKVTQKVRGNQSQSKANKDDKNFYMFDNIKQGKENKVKSKVRKSNDSDGYSGKNDRSIMSNEYMNAKKKSKTKSYAYDEHDKTVRNMKENGRVRKTQSLKYIEDRITTDLRKQVRKGDIIGSGFDDPTANARSTKTGKILSVFNQDPRALPPRKSNFTRADEVKTSDYLRANMEQREVCQLVCTPQSRTQESSFNHCSSISCPCMPCVCLYPCYTCCSESCEC